MEMPMIKSLQAFKKISQEHLTTCLQAGALMTVLSHLGFFSTRFQRVALSSVASICKKLLSDASNFVLEVAFKKFYKPLLSRKEFFKSTLRKATYKWKLVNDLRLSGNLL
ncbi:hypothetical protein Tco_1366317, partial [Tanacetum coccineum]